MLVRVQLLSWLVWSFLVWTNHAIRSFRYGKHAGLARTTTLQLNDIIAIYMNMPDRPARRTFAEEQYRALGLHALRIEGTSKPDKNFGPEHTWLYALAACENRTEKFCLISEDDAVFRPIRVNPDENKYDPAFRRPEKQAPANLTAATDLFFSELNATLAEMPGGLDGDWHGLHLCTQGQKTALKYIPDDMRVQSTSRQESWPKEMFSAKFLMPGAPDTLLLRRKDANLYAARFRAQLEDFERRNFSKPIDTFQGMLYSSQQVEKDAKQEKSLRMFVTGKPQLCQHLADLSTDQVYRTSRPEFSAPG